MKKLFFFLLICSLILPCIYADGFFGTQTRNRTIEFGLNANTYLTNDFLSAVDFFQETFLLDLDDLERGFRMNLGIGVTPFYFSFNNKDNWGFGLSVKADMEGHFHLSGDLLTFSEAVNSKSDMGMAIFAELGIDSFFHIQRFKVKVRPAFYYPIMYMKSDISYTFDNINDGTILSIDYDVRLFSASSLEDTSGFDLTASPGLDISIGAEYPLSEVLGLNRILPVLYFDVGLDLINIPVYPSKIEHYMQIVGRIGRDEPVVFFSGGDDDFFSDLFSTEDAIYGNEINSVVRPFKMIGWASWRPLGGSRLLTIIPSAGFAINPLYLRPFSLEAGTKARLNLGNVLITTLGIGYHDRLWKNSIDLAFNVKVFELNIGADLRAPNLVNSWTGSGLGVNLGLKFGW
jgi:hypothetical protein